MKFGLVTYSDHSFHLADGKINPIPMDLYTHLIRISIIQGGMSVSPHII